MERRARSYQEEKQMKIFAEFYHNSTGYVPGSTPPRFELSHVRLIPACGTDSVATLDARLSLPNLRAEARRICAARGFKGFVIHRAVGGRFSDSRPLTPLEKI